MSTRAKPSMRGSKVDSILLLLSMLSRIVIAKNHGKTCGVGLEEEGLGFKTLFPGCMFGTSSTGNTIGLM